MLFYRRIAAILLCAVLLACACFAAAAEKDSVYAELRFSSKQNQLVINGSRVVAKGKSITLTASEKVTWKSSDRKIATISKKGVVQGIKAGEVKITAKSKANPKVKTTVRITVTRKPVKTISIIVPATQLNLKGQTTVQLEAVASPASAAQKFSWKSSDPKVASISKSGEVTAMARGTVTITARAKDGSGVQASVELTVMDSDQELPEKIRIGEGETEIGDDAWYGNQDLKEAEIAKTVRRIGRRAFAKSSIRYLYIPNSVEQIEEDAFDQCPNLVCLTWGSSYATRWCAAHGIKRVSPDYVSAIIPREASLTVGNGARKGTSVRVQPSVSRAKLKWTSSNEQVFTISDKTVFGNYPGKAELIVSSEDGSVSARIPVTVQANYRALLFSESTFKGGVIGRNRGDVKLMREMLETVTGADGGSYQIIAYDDLTAEEVYEKIEKHLIKPSRDGDVSMFFFASHGDYYSTSDEWAGRLWCKNKETWLELPTLAKRLSKAGGKVIVLLESCGPGAAIRGEETGGETDQDDAGPEDAPAFADLAISAFADADPGLTVRQATAAEGSAAKSGGPFRTEKFLVMTASDYLEISYMVSANSCNLFPLWLTRGVGTAGKMAADTEFGNGDGKLTLNELYQYVYKYTIHKQTPRVYPENSSYVLFLRKQ